MDVQLEKLGRFDEVIERAEAAIWIAETGLQPYSIGFGLFGLGLTHLRRGEHSCAIPSLERCLDFASVGVRPRHTAFWRQFSAPPMPSPGELTRRSR